MRRTLNSCKLSLNNSPSRATLCWIGKQAQVSTIDIDEQVLLICALLDSF